VHRHHERALRHTVDTYSTHVSKRGPIHPEHLAAVVDHVAAADAIFTADTGMCCTWTARYITPNGRRRPVTPAQSIESGPVTSAWRN